jgi:hypothetical protein
MRRIKSLLALVAVLAVMLASAAPAMADDWWDDCNWYWSPWWGWLADCGSAPWSASDDLTWDDLGWDDGYDTPSWGDGYDDLDWDDLD